MTSIKVLLFTKEEWNPPPSWPNFITVTRVSEIASTNELYNIIRTVRPDLLFSRKEEKFPLLNILSFEYRRRWYEINSLLEFNPGNIERYFMILVTEKDSREFLISVVTTAYMSEERIYRAYRSLVNQTFTNWEWIIWSDTPPETSSPSKATNWERLCHLETLDYRIRLYQASRNDGNIGSVKYNASMLARGDLIVELDHDDDFIPESLAYLASAMRENPEAGFFYTESAEVYEENDDNHNYGIFFGRGYGAYTKIAIDGKWRLQTFTAPLNRNSINHLVGMPNHFRAVRTDLYRKVRGNCPFLAVSDDFDLMLKCFLETSYVKIPTLCYIQYRNSGGNNFTFRRNGYIQELCRMLYRAYAPRLNKRFEEIGFPSGEGRNLPRPIWMDPSVIDHPRFEILSLPNRLRSIDIIICLRPNAQLKLEHLYDLIEMLEKQSYRHWSVILSGVRCASLEATMTMLPASLRKHFRYWNQIDFGDYLGDNPVENIPLMKAVTRNYAQLIMSTSKYVLYMPFGHLTKKLDWSTDRLQEFHDECIATQSRHIYTNGLFFYDVPEKEFVWWKSGDRKANLGTDRALVLASRLDAN